MRKTRAPSSVQGRPVELRGELGELARAVGGTATLGALLGVSPRSLQRWARTLPPERARLLIERIASEYNVPLASARGQKLGRSRRAAGTRLKRAARRPAPPVRLPSALGDLARAAGGTIRLAELLGVHKRTVQQWARCVPPASARRLLSRLAAEYGLPRETQRELAHFNEPRTAPRRARRQRPDTARPKRQHRTG
jgi:DNA-binding transcriptional regulator YdaS (Cro superfamily)